jgi:hypothetical protein
LSIGPLALLVALLAASARASEPAHKPSSYDVQQMIETVAVASPYKMSTSARDGTIRYRIELADGETWDWPETAEQHVEATPDAEIVTICKTCGSEPAPTPEQIRAMPPRWMRRIYHNAAARTMWIRRPAVRRRRSERRSACVARPRAQRPPRASPTSDRRPGQSGAPAERGDDCLRRVRVAENASVKVRRVVTDRNRNGPAERHLNPIATRKNRASAARAARREAGFAGTLRP